MKRWRIRCQRVRNGDVYEYIVGEYRWQWTATLRLIFLYLGPFDGAWLEHRPDGRSP